jgi:predicted TIM-barrel fold metal-dependent hydrolase
MRCDSHVHIVGPIETYPQSPERTYLAGVASLDMLRERAATRGISRFVIVQSSFYGTDNTVLLESLDALGDRGRGVAVIDPAQASAAMLTDFAARGIRGLRLNLYSPMGNVDRTRLASVFAATASIARARNWHVEVIAPIELLAEAADMLTRAPVPVVIDHYGVYGHSGPASTAGRQLLDILRRPHAWMKLSAPYRVSDDPLNITPDPEWLTAILGVAKERCVWGSDWPHTPAHGAQKGGAIPTSYRPLSYEAMVDDFVGALASVELTEMILWGNPARLYGFAG